MQPAPLPPDEVARLKALKRYKLIYSLSEEVYDDIARIASEICGTPIALINLIDENQQWTKAKYGTELTTLPREQSFCAHAILAPDEIMLVADARYDERFFDNPLVKGDSPIIFYAGMTLVSTDGQPLGTLCVVDNRPRELSDQKQMALRALAKLVQTNFELRKTRIELEESKEKVLSAQPLVNKLLEELEKSNFTPLQAHHNTPLKDIILKLKEIF
jgi:GAF domain-containing protein